MWQFCGKLKPGVNQGDGSFGQWTKRTVPLVFAVDLTPEDSRPYVGGSKTNSALELALGYNGIQRLTEWAGRFGGGFSDDR